MALFTDAIQFMDQLGVYDVVLPFLIIFTLMYAILERTQLFKSPIKTSSGEIQPSNLHAMLAFSTALLVVGSSRIVAMINQILASSMVLLVSLSMFLILVANLATKDQMEKSEYFPKALRITLISLLGAGILLIFFHAMGWLNRVSDVIEQNPDRIKDIIYSLIILGVTIAAVVFIVKEPKQHSS